MTTYPARKKLFVKTLKSLIMQRNVDFQIYVTIYEQHFESFKREILYFEKYGVIFLFAKRDLKSYKKYSEIAKIQEEEKVVTADDDIYYRPDWLHKLVCSAGNDVKQIVGHRGIIHNFLQNDPQPYLSCKSACYDDGPSTTILLNTGAGVIFPPGSLQLIHTNLDDALEFCPTADDIWIYFSLERFGYAFGISKNQDKEIISWPGSSKYALWRENVKEGQNDVQIRNAKKYHA